MVATFQIPKQADINYFLFQEIGVHKKGRYSENKYLTTSCKACKRKTAGQMKIGHDYAVRDLPSKRFVVNLFGRNIGLNCLCIYSMLIGMKYTEMRKVLP